MEAVKRLLGKLTEADDVTPEKPNRAQRRAALRRPHRRRLLISLDPVAFVSVSMTKRRPWTVKAERRAANRRARVARRANR